MASPEHEAGIESQIRESTRLFALRQGIVVMVAERGLRRLDVSVQLASGAMSQDFIDGKRAISHGSRLKEVGRAVSQLALEASVTFNAVGGLTMGADPVALAVAMHSEVDWFTIRKVPKGRGTNQLVEGAELDPDTLALIVDDVTTTGGSMLKAVDVVEAQGAEVAMAISLVDRGPLTAIAMAERGIPYKPLTTYEDYGIEPITG